MGYKTKEELAAYHRKWYANNKQSTKDRVAKRKYKLREEVCKLKVECYICGENDKVCLDFHHENDDKSNGISSMVSDGRPLGLIIEEAKKCVVVCRNCHAKIHWKKNRIGNVSETDTY